MSIYGASLDVDFEIGGVEVQVTQNRYHDDSGIENTTIVLDGQGSENEKIYLELRLNPPDAQNLLQGLKVALSGAMPQNIVRIVR